MAELDRRMARQQRNPWVLGAAALPFAVMAGVFAAMASVDVHFLAGVAQMFVAGSALTAFAWHANWRPRQLPARVRASEAAIDVEGIGLIPRAEIKGAFVVPRAGKPPLVRIERRGLRAPLEVVPADRAEAEALLQALGFDAAHALAEFRIGSLAVAQVGRRLYLGIAAMVALFAIAAVGTRLGLPELPLVLVPVAALAVILTALAPTRLVVGADGLALRWLWQQRFIPWSAYKSVTGAELGFGNTKYDGLCVLLESGEEVLLPVERRLWGKGEAAVIADRIEAAAAAHRRGGGADAAQALARGERGGAEWLQALRGIGAGAVGGLRSAAVPIDSLYGVLDDPKKPAEVRAAAAVALAASEDQSARQRIRVAADSIAHPRLRVVLERAAGGAEDAALVEALEGVEERAPARPRVASSDR